MGYANDIEDALRNAIRDANYNFRVTYSDMAENSGFNENTLKSFVNNNTTRLPDERETMYCMVRLARWLSREKDCDSVSRIFISPNKHVAKNGGATVDGDLSNEIRALMENNGNLSIADRNNDLSSLKEVAKELGKIVSCVHAEIALKEGD